MGIPLYWLLLFSNINILKYTQKNAQLYTKYILYLKFGRNVKAFKCKPYIETDKNNIPSSLTLAAFMINNNPSSTLSLKQNIDAGDIFEQYNNASTEGLPEIAFKEITPGNDSINRLEFAGVLNGYKNNAIEEAKKEDSRNENVNTVEMDKQDYKIMQKIFDTIAGEDELIQKQEFIDFYNELFDGARQNSDGTQTITRKKLDLML